MESILLHSGTIEKWIGKFAYISLYYDVDKKNYHLERPALVKRMDKNGVWLKKREIATLWEQRSQYVEELILYCDLRGIKILSGRDYQKEYMKVVRTCSDTSLT